MKKFKPNGLVMKIVAISLELEEQKKANKILQAKSDCLERLLMKKRAFEERA